MGNRAYYGTSLTNYFTFIFAFIFTVAVQNIYAIKTFTQENDTLNSIVLYLTTSGLAWFAVVVLIIAIPLIAVRITTYDLDTDVSLENEKHSRFLKSQGSTVLVENLREWSILIAKFVNHVSAIIYLFSPYAALLALAGVYVAIDEPSKMKNAIMFTLFFAAFFAIFKGLSYVFARADIIYAEIVASCVPSRYAYDKTIERINADIKSKGNPSETIFGAMSSSTYFVFSEASPLKQYATQMDVISLSRTSAYFTISVIYTIFTYMLALATKRITRKNVRNVLVHVLALPLSIPYHAHKILGGIALILASVVYYHIIALGVILSLYIASLVLTTNSALWPAFADNSISLGMLIGVAWGYFKVTCFLLIISYIIPSELKGLFNLKINVENIKALLNSQLKKRAKIGAAVGALSVILTTSFIAVNMDFKEDSAELVSHYKSVKAAAYKRYIN
jgi:hypothetical protein